MIDLNKLGFFMALVIFAVVAGWIGWYWARITTECPMPTVTVSSPELRDCALVFTHPSPRGVVLMYDCEGAR